MEPLVDIVVRAQRGEHEAFEALCERFRDMAFGQAYAVLGDYHAAQDAVQDAYVEMLLHVPKLQEPAAFPGWFRTVVMRRALRLAQGRRSPAEPLHAAATVPSPWDGPEAAAVRTDLQQHVTRAIETLPEHEQAAATLYYVGGHAQRDIAEALGVPVTTIKKRLYSSRQRLAVSMAGLADEYFHGPLPLHSPLRDPRIQVFVAVSTDDLSLLERILDEAPELANARNADGMSLLLFAAHMGHLHGRRPVTDCLLRRGVTVDFEAACALGQRDWVLAHPALGQLADAPGSWGRTPLMWAASGGHAALAGDLLARGARVNAQDNWGCTALHLAAEHGHLALVEHLLGHGADPALRLGNGKRPVHVAAKSGHEAIVARLREADAVPDVFVAAGLGRIDEVDTLVLERPSTLHAVLPGGMTLMQMAAESGRTAVAEYLLERGAALDIVSAAELGWDEQVDRLVRREPGAVHASGGSFGFTPLHCASAKGHERLARLLVGRGADINAKNNMFGQTPLGEALFFGRRKMAYFLSRCGGTA